MLCSLHVENYILIDSLQLRLDSSLNIITGETGAGKSILLGALGLVMGARADSSAILDTQRNCIIEAEFDARNVDLTDIFEELDIDPEDVVTIRRIISPNGKSRAYVNDFPVQLTALRAVTSTLIDIHSQHQTLMLADEGFRMSIVDAAADNKELLTKYRTAYRDYRTAKSELENLRAEVERMEREREWVEHQYRELADADLKENELTELAGLQLELSAAETIRESLALADNYLSEDDTGILVRTKEIISGLSSVKDSYSRAAEWIERMEAVRSELRDMAFDFASEAARIEADPERLARTDARLDTIYSLQQKHRASDYESLLAIREDFARKLSVITDLEEKLTELDAVVSSRRAFAEELALKLSELRSEGACEISRYISEKLVALGMPHSRFQIVIDRGELSPDGWDIPRFLFSANPNTEPAPVEKTASGGELSRIMLALKSAAARGGKLPTIVFDEIDAGVSGRIADAVGELIITLAESMQVINITHLPQVASKGSAHLLVYKEMDGQTLKTSIKKLEEGERVMEIAKMLSGSEITDAAVAQARMLLRRK